MPTPVDSFQNSQWSFIDSNEIDPSDVAFTDVTVTALECVSDNVGVAEDIATTSAIMGTRFELTDRSRITSQLVTGTLVFEASQDVLDFFLPYIMGDTINPYNFLEACESFDFQRKEPGTGSNCWEFRSCFVVSATLAPSNGLMQLSLNIIGKTGTSNTAFVEAATPHEVDATSEGYTEAEATVSLVATQRYCESWSLNIVNGLELFQRQSLTYNRARLGPGSVTLQANIEWAAADLADMYGQGVDGIAANVVLDNGTRSYDFDMNYLVIPQQPLNIDGGESLYNFTGVSRATIALPDILTVTAT